MGNKRDKNWGRVKQDGQNEDGDAAEENGNADRDEE